MYRSGSAEYFMPGFGSSLAISSGNALDVHGLEAQFPRHLGPAVVDQIVEVTLGDLIG